MRVRNQISIEFRFRCIVLGILSLAGALGCDALSCAGPGVPTDCYEKANGGIVLHYYGGYPRAKHVRLSVKNADPSTFRHIKGPESGNCQSGDLFGLDAARVYYRDQVIEGADPTTFRALSRGYSTDARRVYFRKETIPGAELSTFRVLENSKGGPFATDGHSLFHKNKKIEARLDPASFEVLDRPYCRDVNHVYRCSSFEPIPGADPQSFVTRRAPKSLATFVHWANDRNRAYYFDNGKLTTIDGVEPSSFAVLSRFYAKDAKRVYYQGRVLVGADAKSFQLDGAPLTQSARDAYRSYRAGKPVE